MRLLICAMVSLLTGCLPYSGLKKPNFGASSAATSSDDSGSSDNTSSTDESTEAQTQTPVAAATPSQQAASPVSSQNSVSMSPAVAANPYTALVADVYKPIDCRTFKWETIARPEDAICLGSVEKIFSSFPDWQKYYYSFMKKTMSNQPASIQYPRVITYAPSGNFVVAAATDPSRSKEVEVAVYDYTNEAWRFSSIDFASNPPKVETELCKSCHGQLPHLIWSDYPTWPGSVGEAVNGKHGMTADDAAYMRKVAAASANNDPSVPSIMKIFTFREPETFVEGGMIMTMTPNTGLSEISNLLNLYAEQKATRMLVSRGIADPKVTLDQKIVVFKNSVCGSPEGQAVGVNIKGWAEMGYPLSTWAFHGIVGKKMDSFSVQNMWNGGETEAFYMGLELLRQTLLKDKTLAAKLPAVVKIFDNAQYMTVYELNTATVLQTFEKNKWHAHSPYDYFSNVLTPFFRPTSDNCKIILGL